MTWAEPGDCGGWRAVTDIAATYEIERPTRTWKWKGRRRNRRVSFQGRAPFLAVAEGWAPSGGWSMRWRGCWARCCCCWACIALLLGRWAAGHRAGHGLAPFRPAQGGDLAHQRISPDEMVGWPRSPRATACWSWTPTPSPRGWPSIPGWPRRGSAGSCPPACTSRSPSGGRRPGGTLGALYLLDDDRPPVQARHAWPRPTGCRSSPGSSARNMSISATASEAAFREALAHR